MKGISKLKRDAVFARHPVCAYCRQRYSPRGRRRTIDHLVPTFRGGTNREENLVGCCHACNVAKGCRTPQEWLEELTEAVQRIEALQAELAAESGVATT